MPANSHGIPAPGLSPADPQDRRLVSAVHPDNWPRPTPPPRYNLVVIGGGPAGLVAAAGAAGLGAKVALVERHFLGGDCLVTGCVPSKALLRSARMASDLRQAPSLGIHPGGPPVVDFAAVMDRVRRLRADLAPNDSAERFRQLGVDVYLGSARFADRSSVLVNGQRLPFAKALVATGARPAVPSIPGLDRVPFLTHESVFGLTRLPERLAILGAGPVGCELAQAFARLGSRVTLVTSSARILPREEPDAADIVARSLAQDGVRLLTGARTDSATASGSGAVRLSTRLATGSESIEADALLVATGRIPNTENLGLDLAGIHAEEQGVQVDDRLRTTNPRVYACGDVCSLGHRFTHAADFQARIVLRNALFGGRSRASDLRIPRCTYTDPEIAQVGLTTEEASRLGTPIDTFSQPFSHVDRAVLEGESEGFVRIIVARGTDEILGATVVGAHAGDLISEVSTAMAAGLGLGRLASVIHPYPTRADALRRSGDLYQRTRLRPWIRRIFAGWLAWQRRG